jgi:hypothetical protein
MRRVRLFWGDRAICLSELKHGDTEDTKTHGGIQPRYGLVLARSFRPSRPPALRCRRSIDPMPSVRLCVLRVSVLQLIWTKLATLQWSRNHVRGELI